MKERTRSTIAVVVWVVIFMLGGIIDAHAEIEFNHYTGEWVDPDKDTYSECMKKNIGNAHTDAAVYVISEICKEEASI